VRTVRSGQTGGGDSEGPLQDRAAGDAKIGCAFCDDARKAAW
jgi:hypothetical protein